MLRTNLVHFVFPCLSIALCSCSDSANADASKVDPSISSPNTLSAEANEPPPGTRNASQDYANARFEPSDREDAVYRLRRDYREPFMLIESVPTYDQGLAMKGTMTPLDRYVFNYHRLVDDSLAFSVGATVLRDEPSQFTFTGTGIWYGPDGLPTARAAFDGGKLHGKHETLDANGEVIATKLYDAGVEYDPERFADATFKPLIGTWFQDTKEGQRIQRLVNEYRGDGTVQIYRQSLRKSSLAKSGLAELSRSDATRWSYRFTPDAGKTDEGQVEYYDGAKLVARVKIRIAGRSFESRTVYHRLPDYVGKRYRFVKQ